MLLKKLHHRNLKVCQYKNLPLPLLLISLFPSIKPDENSNFCLRFKGRCFKQKSTTFIPPNIIFFIVYELDKSSQDLNSDFTLKDCLLGGAKLTKMLIQINTYIAVMVLDSTGIQNFHYLTKASGNMSLFLELI